MGTKYRTSYVLVNICMVVSPNAGLPLVHSGSRNYNGMLKKKHPQEKGQILTREEKTTSMEYKSPQEKIETSPRRPSSVPRFLP